MGPFCANRFKLFLLKTTFLKAKTSNADETNWKVLELRLDFSLTLHFKFMFGIDTIALLAGIGLCVVAALAVVSWTGQIFASVVSSNQAHGESVRTMRQAIRSQTALQSDEEAQGSWNGYRDFVVTKVVPECAGTTSLYLEPADGKPIASFRPGQHITVRFAAKGKPKPLIRCYSLSDAPGKPWYRITVKHLVERVDDENGATRQGLVSTIINTQTQVGDRIPIKTPSGHFFLDENSSEIAVLLAGGIGITPMISMLESIIESGSNRAVVVVYGVRNRSDQAFADHLRSRANQCPNVYAVNCYSRPTAGDLKGTHYQHEGFASVELLKSILPNNQCQFYLCGPSAFMKSIHSGLLEWEVDESRVAFEQFGPSTISMKAATTENVSHDEPTLVSFVESDEMVLWNPKYASILELAEAHDVPIESGCRAGSCGTCETAILNGKVCYLTDEPVDCGPDRCLPCIAIPDGVLELEV